MKRTVSLVICLLLLCASVFAEEPAQSWMDDFLTEHSLYGSSSISYLNLTSGETASYGGTELHPTGNVWEFMLHMYYYEQEAAGAFQVMPGQNEDPEDLNYYISRKTLETCRFESITQGNAATAIQLRDHIGTLSEYQNLINETYGGGEALPQEYQESLVYSSDVLRNALQYLYMHSANFLDLIVNYQLVSPHTGFGACSTQYDVVHFSGTEDGWYCDAAIVFAEEPYCVVAFFPEENGEALAQSLNEQILSQPGAEEAETRPTANNHAHSRDDLTINSKDHSVDRDGKLRLMGITVGVGVGAVLMLLLVFWILRKVQSHRH